MPYRKISKTLDIKSGCGEADIISVPVVYSDGFFARSADRENTELAMASAALSAVIYRGELAIGDALFDFGYKVGCQKNFSPAPKEANTAAYTIGYKKTTIEGKDTNIIITVVRGTVGSEWYSNYNIGPLRDNAFHEGFMQAGTDLMNELLRFYLRNEFHKSETKFWIMGHSRGAAVANYVAGKLTETGLCAKAEDIYAYTFATPAIARMVENGQLTSLEEYPNIKNYLYSGDIVTKVPPEGMLWGFSRFGRNYTLESSAADMLRVKEIFRSMTGIVCEPLTMAAAGSFARIFKTLVPTPALADSPFFRAFAAFLAGMQSGDGPPVSGNPYINALIDKGSELSTRGICHAHSCALYLAWMTLLNEQAHTEKPKRTKIRDV